MAGPVVNNGDTDAYAAALRGTEGIPTASENPGTGPLSRALAVITQQLRIDGISVQLAPPSTGTPAAAATESSGDKIEGGNNPATKVSTGGSRARKAFAKLLRELPKDQRDKLKKMDPKLLTKDQIRAIERGRFDAGEIADALLESAGEKKKAVKTEDKTATTEPAPRSGNGIEHASPDTSTHRPAPAT